MAGQVRSALRERVDIIPIQYLEWYTPASSRDICIHKYKDLSAISTLHFRTYCEYESYENKYRKK